MVRTTLTVVVLAVYVAASVYGGFFHVFTDDAELNRLLRDICKLVSVFAVILFVMAAWLRRVTVTMEEKIRNCDDKVKFLEDGLARRAEAAKNLAGAAEKAKASGSGKG
jgi:hypothetical protein